MKLAALVIVILSHQGYWFGGQPQTITLRPAVKEGLPAVDCIWELKLDGVALDQGKILVSNDKETAIQLKLPVARIRVALHWVYRIVSHNGARELESGDVPINLFPDDLASNFAGRLRDKRLIVWDKPQGLPSLLNRTRAPFLRIESETRLQFAQADVILVGENAVGDSPYDLSAITNLARAGASVMIFQQNHAASLLGYPIAERNTLARLQWRTDHPLLAGFSDADLQSLVALAPALKVVQLPANVPALELGYYPPEAPGTEPSLIDAILLTRSIGHGRIVFCQIPLGDWNGDPRSQMFLRNAIDYLLTRPQPTPPLGKRRELAPVQAPSVPTIPVFWGNQ